jgi:small GTP-binding protein
MDKGHQESLRRIEEDINGKRDIDLNSNLLTDVPLEIVKQDKSAILRYFRERLKGEEQLWSARLFVVGEGGVGKTSLIRKLLKEGFDSNQTTTHGIDRSLIKIKHPRKNVIMNLETWDFGGQSIYHTTHSFFLQDHSLFLAVWNARLGFDQGRLIYWLDTIKAIAPNSPILLVATHIDERSSDLPFNEIGTRYPQIVGIHEISNKTGEGIETLKNAIQKESAELRTNGENWPSNWLNLIKSIQEHSSTYLSPLELRNLMRKNGVPEDCHGLLARCLHERGDIIYFFEEEGLRDIVFLKLPLLSEYIARVFENENVIEQLGIFTHNNMDELWSDLKPNIRQYLLRVMRQYGFTYLIPGDPLDRSIVVERLSYDEVDYHAKWEAIGEDKEYKEVSIRFKFSGTIPAGIPTRFIARESRFSINLQWRYGVLLADNPQHPKHLGLVRAFNDSVQISVRGLSPYNFFALLKDSFELTLSRFPGLSFKRLVQCVGHNGKPCSHEFDFDSLQRVIRQNPTLKEVQCGVTYQNILISDLLLGIDPHITQRTVLNNTDVSPASHIFISYSKKNREYARRLADGLLNEGFDVWIDDRIDYGDDWELAIFKAIDLCSAFIVIMTPNSYESKWVRRECHHADKRSKPLFPLLLEGEEFPRYGLTQFIDVRGERLPGKDFYAHLEKYVPRKTRRGNEIIDVLKVSPFIPKAETLHNSHNLTTTNVIIQHLDEMKNTQIQQHIELIGKMSELSALAQREFTNIYRREQSFEESHCPYVFTITPRDLKPITRLLGKELDLQLYCQHPGHWHPASDDIYTVGAEHGHYIITQPEQWLRDIEPHLQRMTKLLRYVVPVIGSIAGAALPDDYVEHFNKQIELTNQLTTQLWELTPDVKAPPGVEWADEKERQLFPGEAEGASLRTLRKLLDTLDPDQVWGGLQKKLTPEGHYLWLCKHHAAEYR